MSQSVILPFMCRWIYCKALLPSIGTEITIYFFIFFLLTQFLLFCNELCCLPVRLYPLSHMWFKGGGTLHTAPTLPEGDDGCKRLFLFATMTEGMLITSDGWHSGCYVCNEWIQCSQGRILSPQNVLVWWETAMSCFSCKLQKKRLMNLN